MMLSMPVCHIRHPAETITRTKVHIWHGGSYVDARNIVLVGVGNHALTLSLVSIKPMAYESVAT